MDDLIKKAPQRGKGKGAGAGRGAGRGGAVKRGNARGARQAAAPYQRPKPTATLESQYSRNQAGNQRVVGLTTGTKVKITNLDSSVTAGDIEELFGEVGELKSTDVPTGANGNSKGFAIVVYKRRADAQRAMDQYNGVPLDGKPLRISLIGGGLAAAAASIQVSSAGRGGGRKVVVTDGSAGAGGGGRGGRGREAGKGRGGGRAAGRGKGRGAKSTEPKASMEDLDADLDAYRSNAN